MKYKLFLMNIFIILLLILLARYLVNEYNKEVCYNMPFNQFVEDKRCNNFTINDYIKGGDYDVNK